MIRRAVFCMSRHTHIYPNFLKKCHKSNVKMRCKCGTCREKVLVTLVAVTMTASILMALCIGLVAPRHWIQSGVIRVKNVSEATAFHECRCPILTYTKDGELIAVNNTGTKEVRRRRQIKRATKQNSCSSRVSIGTQIGDHPYLASLTIPRFFDDTEERIFACTATILSTKHLLSGDTCVREIEEWKQLRVRVGSKYWSMDGFEYPVKELLSFRFNGLLIVTVGKDITFTLEVRKVVTSFNPWRFALVVGWKQYKPTSVKTRFNAFSVDVWMKYDCHNCSSGQSETCLYGCSGKPVTFKNAMLGIRCQKLDESSETESPDMIYMKQFIPGLNESKRWKEDDGKWYVAETKDAVDVCVPDALVEADANIVVKQADTPS